MKIDLVYSDKLYNHLKRMVEFVKVGRVNKYKDLIILETESNYLLHNSFRKKDIALTQSNLETFAKHLGF